MDIAKSQSVESLPYCQEVEWLQTQAKSQQYIDTQIAPCAGFVGVITFSIDSTNNPSERAVLATYGGGINAQCSILNEDWVRERFCTYDKPFKWFEKRVGTIRVDAGTSTLPFYMFAQNEKSAPIYFMNELKVYSCKMFVNGQPVRDFVPVYFLNDNKKPEGAMYDRVSKTLFRNQGTGSFVIGPDIRRRDI